MSHLTLSVCGALLTLTACVLGGRRNQELASFVLSDYDKRVFPDAADVVIDVNLKRIVDFDAENSVLTLDTWFQMGWNDDRLAWNDYGKFSDVTQLSLPGSSIWIPDVTLYNSADGYTSFNGDINAVIISDGNVTFVHPTTFHSQCDAGDDFDTTGIVQCNLKFGSWTHTLGEIDLRALSPSLEMSGGFDSGKWSYLGSSATRNLITYECCPESYVDVTYTVTLQRND